MVKDRFHELQAEVHTHENIEQTITVGDSALDDFFYQIDLLRSIFEHIIELIRRIQHFQNTVLTLQFDAKTHEELKKTVNGIKQIRLDLKVKTEKMKGTQQIKFNNRTSTHLSIQNFQMNLLINNFFDGMSEHNQAMTDYHQQCRQWIMNSFEIDQTNADDVDTILHANNSIISIIELLNERQQHRYSFDDLKVYYEDIIRMEEIMKELHEVLFYKLTGVTKYRVYAIDPLQGLRLEMEQLS